VRIVFFGSPPPAATALEALIVAGHDVALVVTQPDKRRGRGSAVQPTPVRAVAEAHGITVATPERAVDVLDACRGAGAELGVVVAFGQLLPDALLSAFPRGCINVHYSLLPRWRGAAPVERALLAGDTETGVAIMQLESGLDTGPVFTTAVEPIGASDTAATLLERLSDRGAALLVDTITTLDALTPTPQVGEATHAAKVTVEEFHLDWHRPAIELDRRVRAGNPRPGAWTTVGGARLKVLEAVPVEESGADGIPGTVTAAGVVATGGGALQLVRVQPEGKPGMDVAAWLAGRRNAETVLGT